MGEEDRHRELGRDAPAVVFELGPVLRGIDQRPRSRHDRAAHAAHSSARRSRTRSSRVRSLTFRTEMAWHRDELIGHGSRVEVLAATVRAQYLDTPQPLATARAGPGRSDHGAARTSSM